ncbi:hypothetical protein B9T31_14830 [Acinetobacter sp. ANC 4558]|uniref:hypothetical protein n=1 Tax=Acinetobacter sp. ANC 4558 TaxID=1977876 RepID=UPI000A335CD5|nr:hypothetical protein [Acinetobacter sp. ANC 4558]OTG81797.1 hypothetical protein B9T31_14830 [Acinetobacter sp. ANC 4558]
MSNVEKILKQYAPELEKNIMFILLAPYERVAMIDVCRLTSEQNPLVNQNNLFLRQLQIVRNCYEIIIHSYNQETAKSRLTLLHQTIFDMSPYWMLLGNSNLSEIFKILNDFKCDAHTAFYINAYIHNIEKSTVSKRKATIDKYYLLAIGSLKSATTDCFVRQNIIETHISNHRNDELFNKVQTLEGIVVVVPNHI